jgi:hypothetical protein
MLTAMMLAASTYKITINVPDAKPCHCRVRGPVSREQLRFPLAATIWGEARNQPLNGQRAVGHVIMNRIRADKKRYGHGLRGVTWKRKQFSCWNAGDPNRAAFIAMMRLPVDSPQRRQWNEIKALAKRVYSGQDANNIGSATYYHTVAIKAYWRNDMTVVGVMYDHIFYRPKTKAEAASYAREMKANKLLTRARRIARRANAKKVRYSVHTGGKHGR